MPKFPPLSSLSPEYITEYCGDVLRNITIAFTVLEILFVSLRVLSKRVGRNPYGTDDWLVLASLIMCVVLNITEFLFIDIAGLGRHQAVLLQTTPHKLVNFGKLLVAIPVLYLVATALPRLAILYFYLRIFTFGYQRIVTFIIMGIVISAAFGNIVASLTQCLPMAYMWNKSLHGSCFNTTAYYRYSSLPNIITDICMLLLPLPAVWSLHASFRTKLGLMITLLTGTVGLIASILRGVAFFTSDAYYKGILDHTWTAVNHNIWLVVEPGCYLIAACLLTLRPLLRYILGTSPDSRVFRHRDNGPRGWTSFRSLWPSRGRSTTHLTNTSIPLPIQLPEMPTQAQDTYHVKMIAKVGDIEDQEMLVRN